MTAVQLRLEFCGEEYSADPGTTLTFGRSADVMIDDNRFLHRVLGEFRHDNGLWWLHNVGSAIPINVSDDTSASMSRVAPGTSMPIVFTASTVRFDAGGSAYELTVDLLGSSDDDANDGDADETDAGNDTELHSDRLTTPDDTDLDEPDESAELTTTTTSLPLTEDQFALLVSLAAPLLRNDESLPTNRQLASTLGWTVTKYNRKLDGLCAKFTKAGVVGLHGSADRLAKDRRTRLAEHVVHAGIVTADHLD